MSQGRGPLVGPQLSRTVPVSAVLYLVPNHTPKYQTFKDKQNYTEPDPTFTCYPGVAGWHQLLESVSDRDGSGSALLMGTVTGRNVAREGPGVNGGSREEGSSRRALLEWGWGQARCHRPPPPAPGSWSRPCLQVGDVGGGLEASSTKRVLAGTWQSPGSHQHNRARQLSPAREGHRVSETEMISAQMARTG